MSDDPGQRPAAVLFDNDGLLLNTEPLWTKAEVKLFAARGREFGPDEKRALLGSSGEKAERLLEMMLDAPGEGPQLLAEMQRLTAIEIADGVEPMPGAAELVARLREAGTPLGLVSNSPSELVSAGLERTGLGEQFGCVVTVGGSLTAKPAPDLYLEACRQLGADPSACVALEDSPTGVAAARAAGMAVAGIPSYPGIELDADMVVDSLSDPVIASFVGLEKD